MTGPDLDALEALARELEPVWKDGHDVLSPEGSETAKWYARDALNFKAARDEWRGVTTPAAVLAILRRQRLLEAVAEAARLIDVPQDLGVPGYVLDLSDALDALDADTGGPS